ncbi:hypothetical protein OPT61_g4207 [Boeremia exigua]|uniref:Uncharacterized protein n=1 Tax=Boeremia exigua TaxID=749465 RepID=A0ACC2IEU0_9PLEO|nr:hypothetical protein OPT61_g4207 [Boeremia exigua]
MKTTTHDSNRFSVDNVEVPAQLLRATGNLGSVRDTRPSLTWEPQSKFPQLAERSKDIFSDVDNRRFVGGVSHSTTERHGITDVSEISSSGGRDQHSTSSDLEPPSPSSLQQFKSEIDHRFSFNHEPNDSLNACRPHSATSFACTINTTSIWSIDNPFAPSRDLSKAQVDTVSDPEMSQHNDHDVGNGIDTSSQPEGRHARRGTLEAVIDALPLAVQRRLTNASILRRSSIWQTYQAAKKRGVELQRAKWAQVAFEYAFYAVIALFVYFVLIGVPIWKGAVYWLWWAVAHKFVIAGGFSITVGIAFFYAFAPLLLQPNVKETALLIPCYKSAGLIAATLEASLKIFPPSHIFVLANGNSPTPLDNTEEVCQPYGVNHIWSPIGSKIVAQFVGCYAAKHFENVLLIDDDCVLPENFPVVTERLVGNVQCIGYTIKSVGPNSSKGNLCQQAQDLEYKLSGLQREFAGRIGSATFPHGAISLWNRRLLMKTFHEHPGFSVSEDWFFGHVARKLGCRIKMCSHVFVETETPTAVFVSGGGSRGGFGEMTIFQQRFKRWNFFFVNGMYYDIAYILGSWQLGWWEFGAKIFVFQEVYETLLYLLTPFILPISFIVRPAFCGYLLAGTIVMYLVNIVIFNEVHLRRKNERLGYVLVYVYYLPYKVLLTGINVASCYWSLWKYARYFARRHPKVVEDEKAVEVVVRLEGEAEAAHSGSGRRLTVRTIATRPQGMDRPQGMEFDEKSVSPLHLDLSDCQVTRPKPAYTGLNTPARLREGIAALDYFSATNNN